jgi:hypothetical protein
VHVAGEAQSAADHATDPFHQQAIARARELASTDEDSHPWQVLADLVDGRHRAVVVQRSHGDCGGCGMLVVAAIFTDGRLVSAAELGKFGQYGNGPTQVAWQRLGRARVLRVDSLYSRGGYTEEYESYFTFEREELRRARCLQVAFDNGGAYEPTDARSLAWRATLRADARGGLIASYRVVHRGSDQPSRLPTVRLTAAEFRTSRDSCVAPD